MTYSYLVLDVDGEKIAEGAAASKGELVQKANAHIDDATSVVVEVSTGGVYRYWFSTRSWEQIPDEQWYG